MPRLRLKVLCIIEFAIRDLSQSQTPTVYGMCYGKSATAGRKAGEGWTNVGGEVERDKVRGTYMEGYGQRESNNKIQVALTCMNV